MDPRLMRDDYLHCGRIALLGKRLQTGSKMVDGGLMNGIAGYRHNDRKDRIFGCAHSGPAPVPRLVIGSSGCKCTSSAEPNRNRYRTPAGTLKPEHAHRSLVVFR